MLCPLGAYKKKIEDPTLEQPTKKSVHGEKHDERLYLYLVDDHCKAELHWGTEVI